MASRNDVKEEVSDEQAEQLSEQGAEAERSDANGADGAEVEKSEGDEGARDEGVQDEELVDADSGGDAGSDAGREQPEDGGEDEEQGAEGRAEYDPTLDQTLLKPLFERREKSLKELLESMDEFAPIIPDAVTDYYLARSGLKTNDQRIKRLLALATQKFISDIASDAYQYSRIRSQAGGAASTSSRGRGGQGAGSNRTVLTIESLSGILGDYGINTRRPDFYR